jgi:hypothetical protein
MQGINMGSMILYRVSDYRPSIPDMAHENKHGRQTTPKSRDSWSPDIATEPRPPRAY